MKKVAILGAGISGLAAARHLSNAGYDVTVYEKDSTPGGLAGTHVDNDGFMYDKGPHYFFTTLADKLGIKDKCFRVPFYESIYYKGKYYFFPFGLLKNVKFLLSVGWSFFKNMFLGKGNPENLRQFLYHHYGSSFSDEILRPLLEKWTGYPADEMALSYEKRLLPGNIKYVLYSVVKYIRGYTEDYYEKGRYIVYPRGTMKTVVDQLIDDGRFKLELNSCITNINMKHRNVESLTVNNKDIRADYYISSIPVNLLEAISSGENILREKLKGFRYRGIVILYMKLERNRVLDNLWNWYPEKNLPFYRISEQIDHEENQSKESKKRRVIMIEFGSNPGENIWKMRNEKILELGLRYISDFFGVDKTKLRGFKVDRIPEAYPILLNEYDERQRKLSCNIGLENLFLTGRTGLFQYNMLEDTYDSGILAARAVIEACK